MEPMRTVALDPLEWKIVSTLRDLPEGQLRDLTQSFLADLTSFVREPRCAQFQADGVPCATPDADCEQCLKLKDLLQSLHETLPQA